MRDRDTPLFPEIAQAEGQAPPPFAPFVTFPVHAMQDSRLQRSELSVLFVVIHDCNGMVDGRPGRKVESLLTNNEIARLARVTLGTVRRALSNLAEFGYIDRFTDDHSKGNPRCLRPLFRTFDAPAQSAQKRPVSIDSDGPGGARQWTGGARAN